MHSTLTKKLLLLSLFSFSLLTGCSSNTSSSTSSGSSSTSGNTSTSSSTSNSTFSSDSSSIDKSTLPTPNEVDYETIKDSILTQVNSLQTSTYKDNTTYEEGNITSLNDGDVISSEGNYLLSGNYLTGISITASKDSVIHLFLNNVNITGNNTSGIIKSDKKITLIITLIDGTTNEINATGEGNNVLQVKGDLIINGQGKLNVTTSDNDATGIKVSSNLYIFSSTIVIQASKHGIASETFYMEEANLTINNLDSSKDGIHVECDYDNKKGTTYEFDYAVGYAVIKDSTYTCSVKGDGIQADTFIDVINSSLNIETIGTFVSYSTENIETYSLDTDDFKYQLSNGTYTRVGSDEIRNPSSYYALTQSAKGIKVGTIDYDTDGDDEDDAEITTYNYGLIIDSSNITISSTDDALHTNNGNSYMLDSTITIDTSDDGITCDNINYIDGGTININSSYEGLEGSYIKIVSGDINIHSSDDGINAASDDETITPYILVEDGNINIYNEGDGIDSNGSTYINGGNIVVHGPNNSGDSPLDSETGTYLNYGNVFCYTTSSMLENPSTSSKQYSISSSLGSTYSSGAVIEVKNSSSVTLASVTTVKQASRIIVSLQAFENGQTYSIYVNGTKVKDVTINSIVTSDSSSNPGPGGHGGPGGQGGPGGR